MIPGDAIPFRIRIGVLGLPGATGAAPTDLRATGRRLVEIVQEDVPELLDDESRRRLARAAATPLAYAVVTSPGDELAIRVLDAAAFPSEVRRESAPERAGETRGPRERLVDECDVLLALSVDPVPDAELAGSGSGDAALRYAARRNRPVVGVCLRDPAVRAIARDGIDGRSILRIDLYNRWVVGPEEAARYAANVSREVFDGTGSDGGVGFGGAVARRNREIVTAHLVPHYVRASLLSKRFQRRYLNTARAVYALAVAAVACVAAGALLRPLSAPAFALELVALIAILVFIRRAHRSRVHDTWLQARFLTERLRHAMYLVACGTRPIDQRIPPHVGGREPPDLWMALAFEEICDRLPEPVMCDDETCPALSDFVRSAWVGGQLAYHRKRTVELERKSAVLERTGLWMFGLAIVVAAAHLALLGAHALHLGWPEPPWLDGGLTWLALVLPAAGASIGGYRAHREFSRLAKRSAAMAAALEDVEARLERVSNPDDLEALLVRIEAWMVEEAQGWLMLLGPLDLEAV